MGEPRVSAAGVEVCHQPGGQVHVRNGAIPAEVVTFTPAEWEAFTGSIQAEALRGEAEFHQQMVAKCRDRIGQVDDALMAAAVWEGAARHANSRADELERAARGAPLYLGDPQCRHCGDGTDIDDEDPAPDLCVMCAKAGRTSAMGGLDHG